MCKNGSDKFSILQKVEKEKFDFLNPDSKYNTYFQYKLALYKEVFDQSAINGKTTLGKDGKTVKFPTLKGFF